MKKSEAIDIIKGLYPTDSPYPDTNEVGKKLMLEAIEETRFDWRDLPIHVLVRYAEKCIAKDNENIHRFNEKYHGK